MQVTLNGPGGGEVVPRSTTVGWMAISSKTRCIAPLAFWITSSWSASSSSGRIIRCTYWNSRNAVPSVIAPLLTSTADSTSVPTRPTATSICSAHHMRRNAASRRTALVIASELSSTNRHIAWFSAPLARRSSTAVSRSSMPPYSLAYEPISSDDSRTARWRMLRTSRSTPPR